MGVLSWGHLNVPSDHLVQLLNEHEINQFSSFDDPTSEAPLPVGVHFLGAAHNVICWGYLAITLGHPIIPPHDQSAMVLRSRSVHPSENWISVANRNGFPALTNGDSMTDDDLKWLKSLCVWCVSRWWSELIVQRTQFSPLNTFEHLSELLSNWNGPSRPNRVEKSHP